LLVVKRMGREPGHLPLSSAEIKKTWNHTSTNLHIVALNHGE